jgi:hypothetical protein
MEEIILKGFIGSIHDLPHSLPYLFCGGYNKERCNSVAGTIICYIYVKE